MRTNSLVECIQECKPYLQKGAIYTVLAVSPNGHLMLIEVEPPPPYSWFDKKRFREVQSPEDGEIVLEEIEKVEVS